MFAMGLPVIDIKLIGLATSLLRDACTSIPANEAALADAWEAQGRTDSFPVYYKLEPSTARYGGPGLDLSYSKTVAPWYDPPGPAISSTELLLSLLGLALLAAVQPTGRILGRNFGTPWIMRCFPIVYAADAIAALAGWTQLVVIARVGTRRAASTVMEGRLSGPDAEHWIFALTKSKSAAPARWVAFAMGAVPLIRKLWNAPGALHAQVLGSLYVGAWMTFEAFLLSATIDDLDEEEMNSPVSADKVGEPAADSGDDSPMESPVLVDSPAEASPHAEKDKTADGPGADASLAKDESSPVMPANGMDILPTRSNTLTTNRIVHHFFAAAILISGIYHAIPLLAPEYFQWHEHLTSGIDPEETTTSDIDTIVRLVEVVLSIYLWVGIVAQDLGGNWFSSLDGDDPVFGLLTMARGISGFFWIARWGSAFLFGEGAEFGYDHVLWYAVSLAAYILLQRVGGVKVHVGMETADLLRVYVVFMSMLYYVLEEESGEVSRGVVCRAGGLCYRY